MKSIHQIGDTVTLDFLVEEADLAAFQGEMVHPFYSTFALGRDAEWTCRQFVLNMKESDEEGIGTFLNIKHVSPALLGETVQIIATIVALSGNKINCSFTVRVGDRIIAEGEQGQAILKKEKVQNLISSLK